MGIMTAIEVASSGLTAQRRRLDLLVSNLVNANTTQPAGKEPYRRRDVLLTATPPQRNFASAFDSAVDAVRGVEVSQVAIDRSEPIKKYEPGHPHADKDGYVTYPNINAMQEMVNVMTTTRSYEANLAVVTAAKDMAAKTLEIIK
jgi:flagellar basal-body rod protein FlgC